MTLLSCALLAAWLPLAARGADTGQDAPMIEFKTNIYDQYGADNSFSIMLGNVSGTQHVFVQTATMDKEVIVQEAYVDPDNGMTGTWATVSVGPDGMVRVFGDGANIDYFYAQGAYMEWVEMPTLVNMEVLDLSHNELKRLDLSPFHNLYSIEVGDNPFTRETPLVIGKDKPQLAILEFPMTEWLDPGFNLSDYPSLGDFDAYACQSLYACDPTGCPQLQRLSLDSTPVSKLDVSKNPKLAVLNVSDTRMTALDVSQNPLLQQLYMSNNSGFINTGFRFAGVDVSHNPLLSIFYAGGNDFTSIDVSNNPKLFDLGLEYNQLPGIDISNCPDIYYLNLKYNNMDFATLPAIRNSFNEYYYEQRPMKLERSYAEGAVIDMGPRVLRPDSWTAGALFTTNRDSGESVQVPDDKYSYDQETGVLTLTTALPDSCYMAFHNSDFDYDLTTTSFMVKSADQIGEPSMMVEFSAAANDGDDLAFSLGAAGATEQTPVTLLVDLGDGKPLPFTATTYGLPLEPNVVAKKKDYGAVRVYAPEGADLTAFGIEGQTLYSIDVTPAVELRELRVSQAGLYTVDLRYNRRLTLLDLSGNNLSQLDLAGVNGGWEKNVLADLNLSHNSLSELNVRDNLTLRRLDISYNDFTDFDAKNLDNCLSVNVSHNRLEALSMAYMTAATDVDASHNAIATVTMPQANVMERLDLSSNAFTLATVPNLADSVAGTYVYAPQPQLKIAAKAPAVNLSAQNRVVDGQGTTFTWKYEDGADVPAGKIEGEGGVFHFADADMGPVYCVMANPAFPAFAGDDAYRTTLVQPSATPTNVVAEFTTTRSGQQAQVALASYTPGNAVFFDWAGDGSNLEMYAADTELATYTASTVAGARVKVYTYDADDQIKVFSITDAEMSGFDGSGLKSVYTFSLDNAGLRSITMPPSPNLAELDLSMNAFADFDFTPYPNLTMVSMPGNNLTRLTLRDKPLLGTANFMGNAISTLDLANLPSMFALYLSDNQLADVDLSPVPGVSQLAVDGNKLHSLDTKPMQSMVMMLVGRNFMDFTTLPRPRPETVIYSGSGQAPIDVRCLDGRVDLSSQADVDGTKTEFVWYDGMPEYDENGELVGDVLAEPAQVEQDGGVFTFHVNLSEAICLMTNAVFPNTTLVTPLISVEQSGIGSAHAPLGLDVAVEGGTVTLTGDVADGVAARLVSLDGRTVATAGFAGGRARFTGVAPAAYVVAVGARAAKIAVR